MALALLKVQGSPPANGASTCSRHRALEFFPLQEGRVDFKKLLLEHQDAYQAGTVFPDAFYPSICKGGKFHEVSESTHWTPFLNASIHYIREKYPLPWEKDTEKLVAFLFGVTSHMVADVSWHSLGVEQRFLRTMGAIDFHGSYSEAHSAGDFGGDVLSQFEFNFNYLARHWYIPTQDLLGIYETLYGREVITAAEIADCSHLQFLEMFGEVLAVSKLYPTYSSKSPFLVEQFQEYFLGGLDDMAFWSTNIYRLTSFMLENGTSGCDLPENPLFISCGSQQNHTQGSKVQKNGFHMNLTVSQTKDTERNINYTERGVFFHVDTWAPLRLPRHRAAFPSGGLAGVPGVPVAHLQTRSHQDVQASGREGAAVPTARGPESELSLQDSISFLYQALGRNIQAMFPGGSREPRKHVSSAAASYFSATPYARLGWYVPGHRAPVSWFGFRPATPQTRPVVLGVCVPTAGGLQGALGQSRRGDDWSGFHRRGGPNAGSFALSPRSYEAALHRALVQLWRPGLGCQEGLWLVWVLHSDDIRAMTSADLNQDGYGDLVVGAPGYSRPGHVQVGRVYLLHGNDLGLPPVDLDLDREADSILEGLQPSGRFGSAVAVLDFNQDGAPDLAVGAPSVGSEQLTYTGAVYVYLGSPQGLSPSPNITVSCQAAHCTAGWTLLAADVSGDGAPDLVVGSPFAPGGGRQKGVVAAFHSGPHRDDKGVLSVESADWVVSGEEDFAWFGYSLHSACVDGGSVLLVGSPTWRYASRHGEQQSLGRVYGYSLPSRHPRFTISGDKAMAKLGTSLSSGLVMVDGARTQVLLVGAPTHDALPPRDPAPRRDHPHVQAGARSLLSTFRGDRRFSRFGGALHLSDLDGDGLDEILTAAPLRITDVTSGLMGGEDGRVYMYNGSQITLGDMTGQCRGWVTPCPEEKRCLGSGTPTSKMVFKGEEAAGRGVSRSRMFPEHHVCDSRSPWSGAGVDSGLCPHRPRLSLPREGVLWDPASLEHFTCTALTPTEAPIRPPPLPCATVTSTHKCSGERRSTVQPARLARAQFILEHAYDHARARESVDPWPTLPTLASVAPEPLPQLAVCTRPAVRPCPDGRVLPEVPPQTPLPSPSSTHSRTYWLLGPLQSDDEGGARRGMPGGHAVG
ncbi:Phosphatidylinositol-glycan-specific phospholipase D [Tupaia chinensis]|uniref:Phosphatidylinositol-glycan-specific phospholipase D n=1 Tax=Tupaia chinensis TaxID=246437 RepID=L9L5R5_TUPCH|nr:Phosphatidylinositol-glycan-specific phospholipase D [Tupaia chinensis]